ncbi:ABC transporter ATP-binding protein [Patulibacter medicamentivorans]|uniref:ABC transporter ATP-binding protein n=1 Tax=Patulibacter medicamentivorans TaxID=1097667 RepID=H0E6J1_9ACTN|nr:AAA family ATPase [Patulibacter medicamentivorans]EHN10690.1 ABC transporter ATP-binding protein [Patulibacter medicamentivorans]
MVHRSARERREILRGIRERASGSEPLVRTVRLPDGAGDDLLGYAAAVPAVQALRGDGLDLHPEVTFLVGENGSGKSTLVEAIAVAAGLNPEGGSSQMRMSTRVSHAPLGDHLQLVRGGRRPRTDFFLRAESVFTVATELDRIAEEPYAGDVLGPYGGVSLHELSHGESFLAIAGNRFGGDGFYVLDEPEAALSAQNQLTLLRRIHQLVREGSQFVIATHSPLLLAYPGARILGCDEDGLRELAYDDAPAVALTRSFLAAPERFVDRLLADD